MRGRSRRALATDVGLVDRDVAPAGELEALEPRTRRRTASWADPRATRRRRGRGTRRRRRAGRRRGRARARRADPGEEPAAGAGRAGPAPSPERPSAAIAARWRTQASPRSASSTISRARGHRAPAAIPRHRRRSRCRTSRSRLGRCARRDEWTRSSWRDDAVVNMPAAGHGYASDAPPRAIRLRTGYRDPHLGGLR